MKPRNALDEESLSADSLSVLPSFAKARCEDLVQHAEMQLSNLSSCEEERFFVLFVFTDQHRQCEKVNCLYKAIFVLESCDGVRIGEGESMKCVGRSRVE